MLRLPRGLDQAVTGWLAGVVECGICRHLHVAVSPARTGNYRDGLECPNCHAFRCEYVWDGEGEMPPELSGRLAPERGTEMTLTDAEKIRIAEALG